MPLRRASPEPSPRLRALLDSIDLSSRDEGGQSTRPAFGSSAHTSNDGSASAEGDQPWLPERSWVVAARRQPAAASGEHVVAPPAVRPGRHRRPVPAPPALLVLPTALRGARLGVPRLATIGLLVIVVLAAAGFGLRVAWARAASAPHAVGSSGRGASTGPAGAAASKGSAVVPRAGRAGFTSTAGPSTAGPSAAAAGRGAASASTVTVHVVGQVLRPGVVGLPVGSRVADAVARAGGPRADADVSAINLARVVVDGEQVRVPKPGEAPIPVQGPASSAAGGPVPPADGGGAASSAPVNLNTAGLADLDQLPGVGPVLAQRILDWRTEHQRFASVDELGEVSGIGDKLLAQLRPKVAV